MALQLRFCWVNGQPSSGKDTHVDFLIKRLPQEGVIKISTGDIYRGARDENGRFAEFHTQIRPWVDRVKKGGLVPDEVIIPILKCVVDDYIQEGKNNFFFTGVPRTRTQLRMIDNWMKLFDGAESQFIALYVSRETLRERMEQRVKEANARGEIPRYDDNWPAMGKRLITYKQLTEPMLAKLAAEGRLAVLRAEGDIETNRRRFEEFFDLRLLDPEKYPGKRERL